MLRPTIHNANYSDICAINGFGDVLSERVIDYIQEHPNCDIDELINVKGIGETKLFKLKVRFR
jgi:DNA uptake protein ComE-like DNA-binding protein